MDALNVHAAEAINLSLQMAAEGIFTNALEDSYNGAMVAAQVVGTIVEAHLTAKFKEISQTVPQEHIPDQTEY